MVQTGQQNTAVGFAHIGYTLNLLTNKPHIQFETDTYARQKHLQKSPFFKDTAVLLCKTIVVIFSN